MKKMSTLFRVDYHKKCDPGVIHNEVRPENEWVFTETDFVSITRKWDGQAAAIIEGVLYRRYDAKQGKQAPEGAIPCCDPDPISGHHPHWVKVSPDSPNDRFLWEEWEHDKKNLLDGTYEFCGEKVGGNPENITGHVFVKHSMFTYTLHDNLSFETIRDFLEVQDIEGLVFHHKDGRMCKIRKTDFGFER